MALSIQIVCIRPSIRGQISTTVWWIFLILGKLIHLYAPIDSHHFGVLKKKSRWPTVTKPETHTLTFCFRIALELPLVKSYQLSFDIWNLEAFPNTSICNTLNCFDLIAHGYWFWRVNKGQKSIMATTSLIQLQFCYTPLIFVNIPAALAVGL